MLRQRSACASACACAYNTVLLHTGCSVLNDEASPGSWWGLHWDPDRMQPLNSSHRALTIWRHVSHHFPPCNCMPQFDRSHLHCLQIHKIFQPCNVPDTYPTCLEVQEKKTYKKQQKQIYISFFLPRLIYSWILTKIWRTVYFSSLS